MHVYYFCNLFKVIDEYRQPRAEVIPISEIISLYNQEVLALKRDYSIRV